jgi:NAD(P)-dependent dehydrogenase (short-subunit alcohol dehydrogenase family)
MTSNAVAGYLERLFSLAGRVALVTGGSSGIGRGIALPPDILVNCAAVNLRPPLGELTAGQWDATIALNLTAP